MCVRGGFTPGTFLPARLLDRVTDLRVEAPERVQAEAARRRRRPGLTRDGRLVILACDHPARHVVRVGGDPLAMGDRRAYLERIVRVLIHPEIDGVMATPDILDELFLINHLVREAGGESFLDGKVLVGCINRGGLAGAAWELDDFQTGYTPAAIAAQGLDAAKIMFRLNLQEERSARTVRYCAQWITELNRLGLPTFLEALPVAQQGGAWRVQTEPAPMIGAVGVASALGDSSARLWLKLPAGPEFHRVARATTLPILILGGESHGDPGRVLADVGAAMAAGPNVRGALIGRNVIWPGDGDPQAVAVAVARVVRGASPAAAAGALAELSGQGMDAIAGLFPPS